MSSVSVFLPCRKGSERIPRKNIKPFAGIEHGLIEIKLRQLLGAERVEAVHLSTNDDEILDFAATLGAGKIIPHKRCEKLSSSSTSTDDLVAHALGLVGRDRHILWTHVTSPFVGAALYDEMIETYFAKQRDGYDSLMSTNVIHGFLWNEDGPVNYDRAKEKWPRTQTLALIHEINSAAFIAPSSVYSEQADRIGLNPFKFGMDKVVGMDIDWPEDFALGEQMISAGLATL
ncbi:cytidylyltransferase domain-containing protein [Sinirhodobacter huangdaonensis]|uniref:Acylneuraminate cytidylyltransferase family protein n=1 Tax=Paenirhodobacter huangdaonensis TaxID=2501515 RepID=A0A443LF28_9RHOB|nr:acylneuraminate cytidylyltransferase family protein [Sinirhodobacter huangdaonensis]RWR47718.1 acylneuraminate cytidylyltransferase family protein [Sinirhodobacter huangdaonensis]